MNGKGTKTNDWSSSLIKWSIILIVSSFAFYGVIVLINDIIIMKEIHEDYEETKDRIAKDFEVVNATYFTDYHEGVVYVKNIGGHDIYNVTTYDGDYWLSPVRHYDVIHDGEIIETFFHDYDTRIIVVYNNHNVTLTFLPTTKKLHP